MRVRFFASDKPRERHLARSFAAGLAHQKDRCEIAELCATPDVSGVDAVGMVGVKSKRLFQACIAAGKVPILFDKGYMRERLAGARVWEYWRVSVGAHHPTAGLMDHAFPPDRWDALEFDFKPWRRSGLQIVIAGSSAKYHDFYDLPDPTEWATEVVQELRRHTDRPIVYRPKPSWAEAVPIPDTHYSFNKENVMACLANAWAMVTHGSNACFEAARMGIPSIVLGEGIAAPISSRSLDAINDPRTGKRAQWANNLAYRQWTEPEMVSGQMWGFVKGWVDEHKAKQSL